MPKLTGGSLEKPCGLSERKEKTLVKSRPALAENCDDRSTRKCPHKEHFFQSRIGVGHTICTRSLDY